MPGVAEGETVVQPGGLGLTAVAPAFGQVLRQPVAQAPTEGLLGTGLR